MKVKSQHGGALEIGDTRLAPGGVANVNISASHPLLVGGLLVEVTEPPPAPPVTEAAPAAVADAKSTKKGG